MSKDKQRAKPVRWYVDEVDLIGRRDGVIVCRIEIADLPGWLLVEGFVAMYSKGYPLNSILNGHAKPYRSMPAERASRPRVRRPAQVQEAAD